MMKKGIIITTLMLAILTLGGCGKEKTEIEKYMSELGEDSKVEEGEVSMRALMEHEETVLDEAIYDIRDETEEYGGKIVIVGVFYNSDITEVEDPIMVIPEEIEGYPVKEIYGIPDGVKALYIPDSVE